MAEIIPVAPDLEPDPPEEVDQEESGGGDPLDDDVLAELESSLDKNGDDGAAAAGATDKVELDKADLSMDLPGDDAGEEEPPPELKVDLADEPAGADDWDSLDLSREPDVAKEETEGEEGEKKGGSLWMAASLLGAVVLAAGAAIMVWLGMGEPEGVKPMENARPWFFEAPMPDAETALRLQLKPFIVPLMQSKDGGRVLRVAVSLEVADPMGKNDLTEKTRLCRDVIYRVLRDRPAVEVKSSRVKRLLQAQIKAEINQAMQRAVVYQVYFTDFVITG